MIKIQNAGDKSVAIANSEKERRGKFARIFIERVSVIDARFRSAIIVSQLDIDHARDGVRAVNGRGTVFQNFNALDRRLRNGVEIDKSLRRVVSCSDRIGRDAAAIDQRQRVARIESAQRNR